MTSQFENDDNVNELDAEFLRRDPWRDWTPTLTQGVAVTLTVNYARYIVLARTVILVANLDVTSAGTSGSVIQVQSIPSVIRPADTDALGVIGNGIVQDAGVANYQGALVAVGTNDWRFVSDGSGGYIGASPVAFALASDDVISFQAAYER